MDEKTIKIPGWRIIRVIGKGSFGCVYEIEKEDEFGGVAHSALKVISIPQTEEALKIDRDRYLDDASLTKLYMSRVESVTSEFALMSKLKGDSHIVSYEDHSIVQHEHDPGYDIYIRMELLTPLPDFIRRNYPQGIIPDKVIAKLGADICSALERCGQYRIIHRDIKPQNIFVNDNGDFKLGDFGVAKISDHTMNATKTGTYSYMAPEVYKAEPYNASVDVYSLGMVLLEKMNMGIGPFLPLPPEVPTAKQAEEAMYRRMRGEAIPAPRFGSDLLKRTVLRACAFDPRDRYQSPTEMKRVLEQTLNALSDETISILTPDPGPVPESQPASETPPPWETVYCPYCGKPQRQGAKFCALCGKQMYAPPKTPKPDRKPPEKQKKDHRLVWIIVIIAAVLAIGAVIAVLLINQSSCQDDKPRSHIVRTGSPSPTLSPTPTQMQISSPSPTPSPTPTQTPSRTPTVRPTQTASPTPSPMPTLPPFIVDGEIRIQTKAGEYLAVGEAKTNSSGNTGGYYLEKTKNRNRAIVFRVIRIDGNTVELRAYDSSDNIIRNQNGEDCYLEAYNADMPEKYRGVDLWHSNDENSKRWILEQDNGTYRIRMTGKHGNLYLTDRDYTDIYNEKQTFYNVITIWEYENSALQEWYVETE